MKSPQFSKTIVKPSSCIQIAAGSVVSDIVIAERLLASRDGIDVALHTRSLSFDYKTKTGRVLQGIDADIGSQSGYDDFVEARLPNDKEALRKAEEEGLLYTVSEGFHLNPGSAMLLMGAGGEPIIGYLQALLNGGPIKIKLRHIMMQTLDHTRQDKAVINGVDEGRTVTRPIIRLSFSAVGGTGSGSMLYFLGEVLPECIRADGIEAIILLQIKCRGNLDTADNAKASLNEYLSLKYAQVMATGKYIDLVTGAVHPARFDALFLASNQNCNGNMVTLDQFISHEAHSNHFLLNTEAGALARGRLPDIMTTERDEYGEPRVTHSMGYACISRDSTRAIESLANEGAAMLAGRILTKGDSEEMHELAAGIAHKIKMVESEDKNLATSAILHPAELGNQSVAEQAMASFTDRIGTSHGLKRAAAIENSVTAIRETDSTQTYEPCMHRQGEIIYKDATDEVEKFVDQSMHTDTGIWVAKECCISLRLLAAKSLQSCMEKTNQLLELIQPHDNIFADAASQLNTIRQAAKLQIITNYFLIRGLVHDLEQSGRALIEYQLQLSALNTAVNDFLRPFIDYLDRKIAGLSTLTHKLKQASQVCRNKAESIAAAPTIFEVPLGIELVTPDYREAYLRDYIAQHGGQVEFTSYLLNCFLKKYDSFACLTNMSMEECQEAMTSVCREVFRPAVEGVDVVHEFKRLYPDKDKQREIIYRLIQQSEGSIRTTGEVNI